MTLTVTLPAAADRIGPGYAVQVNTSIGPVPNDDYVVVDVMPAGTSTVIETGSIIMHGSVVVILTLGVSRGGGGTLVPVLQYTPPGAAVDLELTQHHANGSISDTGTSSGWTWDPLGGLYIVAQQLLASSTTTLDEILRRVRFTFPVTA